MKYLLVVIGIFFLVFLFGIQTAGVCAVHMEEWLMSINTNLIGSSALISLGLMLVHGVAVFLTGLLLRGAKQTEGTMFKESFKTYWKNMKYFIVVLGILFLTLLISTSFFARSTYDSIAVIAEQLSQYISAHNLTFEPIAQAFQGKGNFFSALGQVINSYAGLAGAIVGQVGAGVMKITGALVVFAILSVVGIFISHDVVFILSRYNKEANNILEVWFELYVKNVLVVIALVLIVYFISVPFLNKLGLVLLIIFPITYCLLSLIGEWIAAGRERPAFKNVVNVKNVCILFAEDIIVLLISLAIAAVIFLLFGVLVGFYSGLTLLILAAVSISLNAQAFVFGENSWVNYLPDEAGSDKPESEK